MKSKLMFLSLLLLTLILAAPALANTTTIVAVGEYQGVTYVLERTYDGRCANMAGRAYYDSLGRTGCWTTQSSYSRYVLAQQRPTSAMRFLPYSATVTCPPDTTTVEGCIAQ